MGRFFALILAFLFISSISYAQSYLVLPFFNLTGNDGLNWIGESVSESLADSLATEGLLVLGRREREEVARRLAVKPYARLTRATVLKIAMDLDASFVIFGQFEQAPAGLRISGTALDVKKLTSPGQFTESGALVDLSALETRLAWRALQLLAPNAAPPADDYVQRHPTIRVDALENYVRGFLAKSDDAKISHFNEAVRLDSRYSAPAFQLGRLYFQRKRWQDAALWLSRIGPEEIHYREASFFLGLARYHLMDFVGAEKAFSTVAETIPLNEVLNNLGAARSRLNQPEALDSFQRALEGDEADPDYHFNTGYALLKRGEYATAAGRFRAVLERNPNDAAATEMLGRCLKRDPPTAVPPARERLKTEYHEATFLQLKAVLSPTKPK